MLARHRGTRTSMVNRDGCLASYAGRGNPVTEPGDSPAADGLSHLAFFYRDQAEYLGQVLPFIEEGLAGAEPVLVAVPGWNARSMRHALNGQRGALAVLDMAELGRNPARITLAVADFLDQHAG